MILELERFDTLLKKIIPEVEEIDAQDVHSESLKNFMGEELLQNL